MKYPLVYGGIAGAVAIAIISAGLVLNLPSHAHSLWFGYLVMLVSLSLIFVGVKRYRDIECGGVIRFGRAFWVGLAMATVAAIAYAAGWEVFVAVSGYDFISDYSASMVEGMRRQGASQAAIEAQLAELNGFAEQYRNPLFRIPMIFVEIFPVGLVVALASAALLRNPKSFPSFAH